MASVNRVFLLGRLTRDPSVKSFPNGGRVASFAIAINNKRKNQQTGQWEDAPPLFLDCEAFNRGEGGKTADLVEQYLAKGMQVFLEGHLKMDEWQARDGSKKSKLKVVVDRMEFLERREDGSAQQTRPAAAARSTPARQEADAGYDAGGAPAAAGPGEEDSQDIPF